MVRLCQRIMHKHVAGAFIFRRHLPNFDRFAFPQRRDCFGSDAFCLEREVDLIFQIVVPAHGLFLGPIGIHDDFLVDAFLPNGIAFALCHGSLCLKELTDTGEAQQLFCAHHWVF